MSSGSHMMLLTWPSTSSKSAHFALWKEDILSPSLSPSPVHSRRSLTTQQDWECLQVTRDGVVGLWPSALASPWLPSPWRQNWDHIKGMPVKDKMEKRRGAVCSTKRASLFMKNQSGMRCWYNTRVTELQSCRGKLTLYKDSVGRRSERSWGHS